MKTGRGHFKHQRQEEEPAKCSPETSIRENQTPNARWLNHSWGIVKSGKEGGSSNREGPTPRGTLDRKGPESSTLGFKSEKRCVFKKKEFEESLFVLMGRQI